MPSYRSPTFALTGAVPPPEGSTDSGVPWHYGDPHGEQRALAAGRGSVDLSHRDVVRVCGPDRLDWLHSLTTQHLERLSPGASSTALILSPHGHVEHELHLIDDGECTWLSVEPGTGAALIAHLDSMRFMLRVEVDDVTPDWAVVWQAERSPVEEYLTWLEPADFAGSGASDAGSDRGGDATKYVDHRPAYLIGREILVPRGDLLTVVSAEPAGTWALEALRVAAGVPRLGFETDHRTLPHEVGWVGPAVHLSKGCYRGQEAVARVHNLGSPPRRLVLLHLDGSEVLPGHGDAVYSGDRSVGWIGTAARHFELGTIATAIVKRSTPTGAVLEVESSGTRIAAAQESVITAGR